MKIRDMDWGQLEAYCLTLLRQTLQDDIWRIHSQADCPERDGLNQRMHFHIAEHRHDGLGYVIACTHYPDKVLSQEDIEQVLAYQRLCHAAGGIMLLSSVTRWTQDFPALSQAHGIAVVTIDLLGFPGVLQWIARQISEDYEHRSVQRERHAVC
jgi:hypothetical protein